MKGKNYFVFVSALVILLNFANPLHACVGRLLVVAVGNSVDQVIMGQMLSQLITERTGTSVDIVQPGDFHACHQAVLEGKADIYVNYVGMAQGDIEGANASVDPQEAYILVSQSYKKQFGLIWLKPFGFQGPLPIEAQSGEYDGTWAVPVVSKDTLKKFPVLDRIINKLGGRVDNKAIEKLREKSENQDIKTTVREFLKSQNLI